MKNAIRAVFLSLFLVVSTLWVQAAPLSLTETHTDVSCYGGNNGTIDITVTGGTAPYIYLWSDLDTTQDRSNLAAGTYSLTVIDLIDTATITVLITEPLWITTTTSTTPVSCGGGNDGTINLVISGGTPPYGIVWSDGPTLQNRVNMYAANYYVTVTDANGCVKIDSANVIQPMGMVPTVTTVNTNCSANNGSIDLTVQYGYPAYTYLWNDGITTTEDRTGMGAGTYTVTITDNIACTISASATVNTNPSGMVINNTSANPSCNGGSNGTITITSVVGSIAPYSFAWNDGVLTQNRTGLAAGAHTVTATSSVGCSVSKTITLTDPAPVTVSLSPVPVSCFGGANGAINTTPGGGTSPYSFSWSDGKFTQNITGLTSNNYTVTVTDFRGCTATATAFVAQPSLMLTATAIPSPLACTGGPSGSVVTSVIGGTGAYYYVWSGPGGATFLPNRMNVNAGTYFVTVTDDNGCVSSATAVVPGYTPMSSSATQVNNICNGGSTGSINLTVNNGWAPYTYIWSNTEATQDIINLPAASYTVTVTDTHACTITRTVNITQPSFPVTINATVNDVMCNGGNNGSITTAITNATAPFGYIWNDGPATANRTALNANTYTLTVTDNIGCSASASYTVNQPSALNITATATNVNCFGNNNGAVDLTVTGGFAPYTYSWTGGYNTQNISGLSPGSYAVTVTDNHLCSAVTSAIVSQPSAVSVSAVSGNATCAANSGFINITVTGAAGTLSYIWNDGPVTQNRSNLGSGTYAVTISESTGCDHTASATINATTGLNLSAVVTGVRCNGGSDGSIVTSVTGGAAPYTYLWNGGIATPNRTGLVRGWYDLTVTDNGACSTTASYFVDQPEAILLSPTATDVLCNGQNTGSIMLTVGGGTGPYTFAWSNGFITQDISSLAANTYTVTATDAVLCTATVSATVAQPTALTISTTVVDVRCFGGNNGSIDLTVSGGTGPYLYAWSNSTNSQDLNGLTAGNYLVNVVDGNNCVTSTTATVLQPAQLTLTATPSATTCTGSNGSIILGVNGGTGAFTFNWSNGFNTQNISNLAVGTYSVTTTDANLCSAVTSATITAAGSIAITGTTTDVLCFGGNNGAITAQTASGGPFTYLWSNNATTQTISSLTANTYSVTVSQAVNCSASASFTVTQPAALQLTTSVVNAGCSGNNGAIDLTVTGGTSPYQYVWNNSANTQDINGLGQGTFDVLVTDAHSCVATTSATVTQAAPLTATTTQTNVNCFGAGNGSVNTIVSGGSPFSGNTYHYNWSNSANTQNISSVNGGNYAVTITDAAGCQVSASATITEPTQIVLSETHTNVSCNGGANGVVLVTPTGGAGSYTYLWNTSATGNIINTATANTYSVTVTDGSNCTAQKSITITQPALLAVTETHLDNACAGRPGSINITMTGGTAPYQYNWGGGITTEDRNNISGGNYTVNVRDYNNCVATKIISISNLPQLNVALVKADITCNGVGNGQVTTNISGGTAPYTYLWTNNSVTQNLNHLNAGSYALMATDANGCSATGTVSINEPTAILTSTAVVNVKCYAGNNGAINLSVSGGNGPYTYNWTNASHNEDVINLTAGNYNVTVTDASGCRVTASNINISQPTPLTAVGAATPVSCAAGSNDGSVDLEVTGGTTPYFYQWANNLTTEDIQNLVPGTYAATVTDNNGCKKTVTAIVAQTPALNVASLPKDATCNGVSNGTIDVTVLGGVPAYNYKWSNGETTEDLDNVPSGSYNVTITDATNCSAELSFNISNSYTLEVTAESDSKTIAQGEAITLSASANVDHGNVFTWTPAANVVCANCSSTLAYPSKASTITVNVVDENGCRASADLDVTVNEVKDLFVPNVFTPNKDGANDVFKVYGDMSTVRFFNIKIFNRWGEKVYESSDHDFEWDGTYKGEPVQRGVYVYTMKVTFSNGESDGDHKGSITVLK